MSRQPGVEDRIGHERAELEEADTPREAQQHRARPGGVQGRDAAGPVLDLGRRQHRPDQLGPGGFGDRARPGVLGHRARPGGRQRHRGDDLRRVRAYGPAHRGDPDGPDAQRVREEGRVPPGLLPDRHRDGLDSDQHLDHPRPQRGPAREARHPRHAYNQGRRGARHHGDPGRPRDARLLRHPHLREVDRAHHAGHPRRHVRRRVDRRRRAVGLRRRGRGRRALDRDEPGHDRHRHRLGDHLARLRLGLLPLRPAHGAPFAPLLGRSARPVRPGPVARHPRARPSPRRARAPTRP